jgi:hypothetical protein
MWCLDKLHLDVSLYFSAAVRSLFGLLSFVRSRYLNLHCACSRGIYVAEPSLGPMGKDLKKTWVTNWKFGISALQFTRGPAFSSSADVHPRLCDSPRSTMLVVAGRVWSRTSRCRAFATVVEPGRTPQTFIEKVVQKYAVGLPEGKVVKAGDYVMLRPEHVMTHDNTGPVISKCVFGIVSSRHSC